MVRRSHNVLFDTVSWRREYDNTRNRRYVCTPPIRTTRADRTAVKGGRWRPIGHRSFGGLARFALTYCTSGILFETIARNVEYEFFFKIVCICIGF